MKRFGTSIRGLLLAGWCTLLLAFAERPGGDSFRIYIDGKLMIQHFVSVTKGVQHLQLGNGTGKEKIEVYYNHCGVAGKDRRLQLKDQQNRTVREWQFPDTDLKTPMAFKAQEVLAALKSKQVGKLHYASRELPDGFLLATVSTDSKLTAAR